MVDTRPRRRLYPFVVVGMLVVLAATSLWGLFSVRSEMYVQVQQQLEAQLQDQVASWEESVVEALDEWRDAAAAAPANAWVYENRLREKRSWFDALYLWQPPRVQMIGRDPRPIAGRFLYPLEPPTQRADARIIADYPCLTQPLAAAGPVAEALGRMRACESAPEGIRLYKSGELATHLKRLADLPGADKQGLLLGALKVLDAGGLDKPVNLRSAINQHNIDPNVLVNARMERANVLFKLSEERVAVQETYALGLEIASLDAPEYRRLLLYTNWVSATLRDHDRRPLATSFEKAVAKADRRLRAFNEIRDRVLRQLPAKASQDARFIYDQYSEAPFLLYLGPVQDGEGGAAIQIDQEGLIKDFIAANKRWKDHLVVTDLTGKVVAGPMDGGKLALEVPFTRTLTSFRVGMRQAAIDERMAKLAFQWFIPLGIVVVCLIAGVVALWFQIQADRQLQRLYVRQREFTARVTHELKTPLAGIKIMAENLEAGRYKDMTQARQMALSILQEADRLALRVNEILDVAKERKIPDPKPFDPEEVALEAIDTWGPRLEQAGVTLNADLDAAEPVLGDGDAMRDALGCLLDNALKYRKEERDDNQVWMTLRQEAGDVVYEVKDNGIGVPKDKRTAIFERFVRVEGPNRGTAGGHGLGLAQVKAVVEQHGGTVECREGEEGGALFVIRLPAIPART